MIRNILLAILFVFGIIEGFFACTSNTKPTAFDKTELVDSLLKTADNYRAINMDTMLELSIIATDLASESAYQTGFLQGTLQQGIAYFYQGKDSLALEKIKIIEQYSIKSKREKIIFAKKNSLKGSIFHNRDLYDSAAVYMFESLRVFEKEKKILETAMVAANIATNYILTENYDKALLFTQKAAVNFKKEKHKEGLIAVYERMGSIYSHQEQYDSALFYFQKSLNLAEKINHIYFIANGYHNIGSVYMKREQFEIGETYLQKAMKMYKEQNNLLGYSMTLSNLAQIDLDRNFYQNALSKYQVVNQIAKEGHFLALEKQSYEKLSTIYEHERDFELALKNNQAAQIINDSINQTEQLKAINKLENQYLTAQKDKIILGQQLDIQAVKNQGLLILLSSIIILSIAFFIILKRKNENKLLTEKNNLIQNQQRELKHRTENQLEQLSDLFTIYGLINNNNSEIIKEAQSRVESINLVYRYLSNSLNNEIEIKPFLTNLVDNIFVIYGLNT